MGPWPQKSATRTRKRRRLPRLQHAFASCACISCAGAPQCICMYVTWLWHTYIHTHMYTQVFHFQKQAVSAQWDASQGEKQTRFQEVQNLGTRFYSTLRIILRGYSSYFYCFIYFPPSFKARPLAALTALAVFRGPSRPCGTYQLCMSLTCRSIVCCVSSTTVHPGKVQRNLCGCKNRKRTKAAISQRA